MLFRSRFCAEHRPETDVNLNATAGTATLRQEWPALGSQRHHDGRHEGIATPSYRGHRDLTPVARGSVAAPESRTLERYRAALTWAFTFFSSVRVLSYLPTMWTLWQSGDSSQHSLWTWCTWFCANLTMSLWLIDRNGARVDRAALVNLGNAAMCLAVIALIVVERL